MATIQCDIVSAEGSIFSGAAEMVIATGEMGDLGVSAGHSPLLTGLKPGPVRVLANDDEVVFYVSGGFLEVQPNVVTVLADTAARGDDLDEAAAIEAQQRAEQAMANQSAELDYTRAAAELAAAVAQLRTIQQIKKKLG
jgi:F-type H+-transporting ATPase subunit epsilon|tara:strand:- start:1403 stop:1819 length:417 start_codon:yes stop_codon:yes gene_type:complete